MPLSIQAKLLRMLQDRQFYPVGSEKPVVVNVRIIVATNKDLEQEVAKGSFRLDLFYRLHVIPIHLPPLRERKEDIPLLADRFLKQISQQMRKDLKGITPEAMQKAHALRLAGKRPRTGKYLGICDRYDPSRYADGRYDPDKGRGWEHAAGRFEFSFINGTKTSVRVLLKTAKYEFEKEYLLHLLKLCGGKASEATKLAGKSRTDFL